MGRTLEELRGVVKHDYVSAFAFGNVRLSDSGTPYVGRGNRCMANNDTCEARRMEGSDYCVGHTRQLRPELWEQRKLAKETDQQSSDAVDVAADVGGDVA